jgi:hypothetical protein
LRVNDGATSAPTKAVRELRQSFFPAGNLKFQLMWYVFALPHSSRVAASIEADNWELSPPMRLAPIDRTDRGLSRLHAALNIYRETILPEAQNPERQILYWIDHSKDDLADEFRCFAIQNEREVVGYFQYSYFREENVFFFEYLCIRAAKHTGMVPSEAINEIAQFLGENYPPDFTIVFEVARKRTSSLSWPADTKLLRYFERLGFRKIEFSYRYPVLQSYDGEISYPADLMVRLPQARNVVTSFEMRTLLRCIYFKHYLRWDRPFLDPERFAERERLINELYSAQVSHISGDDDFPTSGRDRTSLLDKFIRQGPRVSDLLSKIFGPKLPRLIVVILIMLGVKSYLGSGWMLFPFVLAVAAVYCLAEDTTSSHKLFLAVIAKFNRVPR